MHGPLNVKFKQHFPHGTHTGYLTFPSAICLNICRSNVVNCAWHCLF